MASVADSEAPTWSDEQVCLDLYNAADNGKLDEVTRLLPLATEKGVVDKVAKGTNVTSVWIAARNGHDKVVSTLLANGASARAAYMNNPNFKALHAAAFGGHKLCIAHLLLADDSILRVKDNYGDTPADKARRRGKYDIVAALSKWASGDKAGALRDLGAAHLISSLPSASATTTTAPVTASTPAPAPAPAPAPPAPAAATASAALAQAHATIHQRDSTIQQRDSTIQQRDATIQQLMLQLADKDAQLAALRAALGTADRA